MRKDRFLTVNIFVFFLFLKSSILYSQVWPVIRVTRFLNCAYYNIDSLDSYRFKKTIDGKNNRIAGRYFDIYINSDSIGLRINDSVVYFKNSIKKQPICYKKYPFYLKRNLYNKNFKIQYLKLTEVDANSIVAQAYIKTYHNVSKSRLRTNIILQKSSIQGIYLGSDELVNTLMTGIELAAYGVAVGLSLF